MDLRVDYLKEVIEVLYQLWRHPVWLETIVTEEEEETDPYWWIRKRIQFDPFARPSEDEEKSLEGWRTRFSYDGRSHSEEKMEKVKVKRPF